MANETDEGLVLALSIDGLCLGDDDLKAVGKSLLGLIRYHDRKELQLKPKDAVYNVTQVLAARSNIELAFVPDIVERFPEMTAEQVGDHLIQLCREGRIELRCDSGLGRFTKSELDACPDGTDGSKMLWARVCRLNRENMKGTSTNGKQAT
jgi:hypothetical protein